MIFSNSSVLKSQQVRHAIFWILILGFKRISLFINKCRLRTTLICIKYKRSFSSGRRNCGIGCQMSECQCVRHRIGRFVFWEAVARLARAHSGSGGGREVAWCEGGVLVRQRQAHINARGIGAGAARAPGLPDKLSLKHGTTDSASPGSLTTARLNYLAHQLLSIPTSLESMLNWIAVTSLGL